jgi:adenylate cyclase
MSAIERRITGALLFSNLDGALFVFAYLVFLSPQEMPTPEQGGPITDVVLFVAFAAVAFPLCGWLCERTADRYIGWLKEERRPTDEEREGTLRLPFLLARLSFATWIVAAVFFTAVSIPFGHELSHFVKIGGTILIGGLVSCTISFLLVERAMRPVFAEALADGHVDRTLALGVRPRLVLSWALGSGIVLLSLAVLPISAQRAGVSEDIGGAVAALALAGLVVGLLITVVAARAVADPLEEIRRALDRVRTGDLDVVIPVDDGGEVGMLQSGVNQMVAGLRERQRLADLFGRHVGTEVAERALVQGSGLSSEQRDASALFVDLVGSTAMAEVLAPEAVVETLNSFFGAVVRVVAAEGGWVNKFEGDGALCVFGAPARQPDHAARALRAARRLRDELAGLAVAHPGLDAAIGVSSGRLVAGNVGTEQRYEYTVIGRPVIEAARLSDLA